MINGPNLNLLGTREPEIYGTTTLEQIQSSLQLFANAAGHELVSFQSNAEHDLIKVIQQSPNKKFDFIIINPGGFTSTSVAIRDALLAVAMPFIEVHLSNIFAREEFRKHSYLSDIAVAVVSGMGVLGYEVAIEGAEQYLDKHKQHYASDEGKSSTTTQKTSGHASNGAKPATTTQKKHSDANGKSRSVPMTQNKSSKTNGEAESSAITQKKQIQ